MRISRLDLFGFKSFPDRTTFHFGPGVSCVVGPNGSGKSNVVDALRWCIGEQSPRSLRGAEMADVIFAGSEDRRPVGFAEVQLSLITQGDDPFPGDYAPLSEVQVGRRLHRSGASEYLINQSRVRRRDVVELLMDSGIGNNLYSFIAQGQVDRVITATPEERRAVIDEAAGIARYKSRRAEAQGRLLASAAQLDRASDVVDEMQRRLRTLERQVVRAAEFRRRRARIRHAELHLALAKVHGLTQERSSAVDEQRGLQGREGQARDALAQQTAEIDERRREVEVVAAAVATRRDRLAELDAQIREQEATRRLHEERRIELVREAARASEEVSRARTQLRESQEEAERVAAEAATLTTGRRELEEQAVVVHQVAEQAHAAASEAIEAADQADATLREIVEQRLREEGQQASIRARIEALEERGRALEAQLARTMAAQDGAAQAEALAEAEIAPARQALASAEATFAVAEAAWTAARAEQEVAEGALGDALRQREERLDAEQAWMADVQRRGRAWVDATEVLAQGSLQALEGSWRQRVANAEAHAAGTIVNAVQAARASAGDAAAARVTAADEALHAAGEVRDAADVTAVDAEEALRLHEIEEHESSLERSRAQARLAGAQARLSVDDEALEDQPRLLDLVPQDEQPALLDRLGERALRPMVADLDALVRAANAIDSDVQLQAWFRPDRTVPEVGRAPWLPSLRAALQGVAAGRGAAAGPGFRVSADGWVELGTTAPLRSAAEQEQAIARQLAGLEERTQALQVRRTALEEALTEARERRRQAEIGYREAQERATRERHAAHAEATAAEADALAQARAASEAEQHQLVADRARELNDATHQRAARVAAARDAVDQALRELTVRAPDADGDARIGAIEGRAAEARRASQGALLARDGARLVAVEATRSLERAEAAHQAAVRERERQTEEGVARHAELAAVGEDIDRAQAEVQASEGRLTELRASEAGARDEVVARQTDASVAGGAEEKSSGAVSKVEHELARMREVGAGLKARQDAARERHEAADSAIARAQARAAEAAGAIEASERARDQAASLVATATEARSSTWDALEQERGRLGGLQRAMAHTEQELDRRRRELGAITEGHEALAARLAEVNQEIRLIAQRMDDRYQVAVSTLLEQLDEQGRITLRVDDEVAAGITIGDRRVDPVAAVELTSEALVDEDAIRRRVRDLEVDREQLGSLGEVNLAAIDEYRDLAERHEQMLAQQADLEESMRSIRAAIAKMNELCTERFTLAFEQVKVHFQEIYPRLVGGGSARLALTDDGDILESGVEIFVQPPGKRLQNLSLLSGGEKAMTAIALLIALFRVKPSPFCVLDEVDAPLDEANGARFNEVLREMALRSQFLVITHNRKTMECADTLYGITMARPGVSKLVSVRM